ncbi:EF-hand domain-containing protein [Burkholderia cenocepacia]|uniref:EF-hand domain-containing protein n=1 Tax=Burkholderia cenocepacia TaxID=95486 RepID=UPI002AB6E426|nr:EF-hand domain-containing protein [Burkholderia cenocepacia]
MSLKFSFLVIAIVVDVFGVSVAHAAASNGKGEQAATEQAYIEKSFKMIDTNHDGMISHDEWNVFLTRYLEE